jgi:hypothetical protein
MSVNPSEKSHSWFCVLHGPESHFDGTPEEIVETAIDRWCDGGVARSGIVAYCVSSEGVPHLHMVLEAAGMARFSAIKAAFPKAHIELTKGSKTKAEAYIFKDPPYDEKGEKLIAVTQRGETKGKQKPSSNFDAAAEMVAQGLTPRKIFEANPAFWHHEVKIRKAFNAKRMKETPMIRDVKVYYHIGATGSGKTYTAVKLAEKHGEEELFMMGDFERGGLDGYNAEKVLFMDEFRGQMPYAILLKMLDKYKIAIGARYANILPLWTEVHIATTKPPEKLYESKDKSELYRRIHTIVYHWKDGEKYHEREIPMSDYIDYETLEQASLANMSMTEYKQKNSKEFADMMNEL